VLADLVRDGLIMAHREMVRVGKRKITVARVWITAAGRAEAIVIVGTEAMF
jgi:hypothetical protein